MPPLRLHTKSLIAALVLTTTHAAMGKEFGFKTPSGRRTYKPHETFQEVVDHKRRILVSEVAVGAGPEGNIGLLLGWLNAPIRHLDLYAGIGLEANPAALLTGAARYTLKLDWARPYIYGGYLLKNTYEVGIHSHNIFAELGNTWVIHRTFRLSLGIGLRRIIVTKLNPEGGLSEPELDPQEVQTALDDINPWLPTFALRFSRAF